MDFVSVLSVKMNIQEKLLKRGIETQTKMATALITNQNQNGGEGFSAYNNMELKVKLLNVEYDILNLTGREISLIETAILQSITNEEKDSDAYYHLKIMIDKIEEATSKVNKY